MTGVFLAETVLFLFLDKGLALFGSGRRIHHFDVRFGAFGKEWSFRRPLPGEEATGFTNVFPIPADILALNPKLSQNEGY